MRVELEPAYVLARRSYRETSLLLEVFTAAHGRVGLVARGVRGAKGRQSGLLQTFTPLLLSWKESGELGTLTAAEPRGVPPALSGERVFHGWYVNELLLKLLQRQDPHPQLYLDYEQALAGLAAAAPEPALRLFEKHLLAEIGYGLPLQCELEPAQVYAFDFERGPRPAPPGASGYAGASLLALRDERLSGREQLRDARRLLGGALQRQLGGRELETPRLLRALRGKLRPPEPGHA
ncbi:MAG: DNA repair protein RecO [Nevskia sp.]|nr:DNA repair protein RecO [Nevskia sp.]